MGLGTTQGHTQHLPKWLALNNQKNSDSIEGKMGIYECILSRYKFLRWHSQSEIDAENGGNGRSFAGQEVQTNASQHIGKIPALFHPASKRPVLGPMRTRRPCHSWRYSSGGRGFGSCCRYVSSMTPNNTGLSTSGLEISPEGRGQISEKTTAQTSALVLS